MPDAVLRLADRGHRAVDPVLGLAGGEAGDPPSRGLGGGRPQRGWLAGGEIGQAGLQPLHGRGVRRLEPLHHLDDPGLLGRGAQPLGESGPVEQLTFEGQVGDQRLGQRAALFQLRLGRGTESTHRRGDQAVHAVQDGNQLTEQPAAAAAYLRVAGQFAFGVRRRRRGAADLSGHLFGARQASQRVPLAEQLTAHGQPCDGPGTGLTNAVRPTGSR